MWRDPLPAGAESPQRTPEAALRMPEPKGRWWQVRGGALDKGPPQWTHLSQRVPPRLTPSASTAAALGSSICWGSSHGSGAAGPLREGLPAELQLLPPGLSSSAHSSPNPTPEATTPSSMTSGRSCSSPKARLWEALEVREKGEPETLLAPAPLHRLPSLLPASLHSKPLRAHMVFCVD